MRGSSRQQGSGPSRRQLLVGMGVVGVGAAVPAAYLAWPRSSSAGKSSGLLLPVPGHPQPHSLQIVAHQDDDLLFCNPDLTLIRSGVPTTTVYLTAGEANGAVDGSRNRTQFAADRQTGARAAYAQLAGVDNQWRREDMATATGQHVELATLNGAEHVRLVFISLPDAGDSAYGDNGSALPGLLLGKFPTIPTLVPDGGPVTAVSQFTKDALVGTLADLIAQFQPSVVRTLDPQYAEQNWRGARNHGGDNVDHSAAARFADLAVRKHLAKQPAAPLAMINYVGYGVASMPGNVTPTALTAKTAIFTTYAENDGNVRTFRKNYDSYLPSQRYRWAPPTPTIVQDGAHGMAAFAVLGRQVIRWRRPGTDWGAPQALGPDASGDVVALSAVRAADGRIRLFALLVDLDSGDGGGSQIVTAVQATPGGAFGPWQSLGGPLLAPPSPAATPAQLDRNIPGAPVAVATPTGDVVVVAAAPDGSLHSRTLKAGTEAWPAWTEIIKADLVDLPSVTAAKDGTVDLYASAMVVPDGPDGTAPAACRLLRWRQGTPGGTLLPDTVFPNTGVLGPPVAVRSRNGVAVFCLTRDGKLNLLRSQFTGAWSQSEALPAADLIAAPAGQFTDPAAGGSLLLAARNADASISVLEEQPGQGFPAKWTSLGAQALGSPTVASDPGGRVDIAIIDSSGQLAVASRLAPQQPFSKWQVAGS